MMVRMAELLLLLLLRPRILAPERRHHLNRRLCPAVVVLRFRSQGLT